jgi:hypothetical protein
MTSVDALAAGGRVMKLETNVAGLPLLQDLKTSPSSLGVLQQPETEVSQPQRGLITSRTASGRIAQSPVAVASASGSDLLATLSRPGTVTGRTADSDGQVTGTVPSSDSDSDHESDSDAVHDERCQLEAGAWVPAIYRSETQGESA